MTRPAARPLTAAERGQLRREVAAAGGMDAAMAPLRALTDRVVADAAERGFDTSTAAAVFDAAYAEDVPHRPGCSVELRARPGLERLPARHGGRLVRCPECAAWVEVRGGAIVAASTPLPADPLAGIRAELRDWPDDEWQPDQAAFADRVGRSPRRVRELLRAAGTRWRRLLLEVEAERQKRR